MPRADITSLSYGKSTISPYTLTNGLVPPLSFVNSEMSGRKEIGQNRLLVFLLVPPDHDDIS